jgi:four helix bundle protein
MNREELQQRTKRFHVNVIKLCSQLPRNIAALETAKQLIRSAGSVAANYRASARAKSRPDFLNKVQIILEEADESHYWLEAMRDSELVKEEQINHLIKEANELTAIFAATTKSIKKISQI